MTTCPMSSVCMMAAVLCIHSRGTGTQSRHRRGEAEHSSARRAICSDTPTHPCMLKHSDTSPCKVLPPLVSMGSVQRAKRLIVDPFVSTHGRGWAGRVSFCPLVLITRLGGVRSQAPGLLCRLNVARGHNHRPCTTLQIGGCRYIYDK